jgi:heme-degrading monooxygenase HmoA
VCTTRGSIVNECAVRVKRAKTRFAVSSGRRLSVSPDSGLAGTERGSIYAVIRKYPGNSELADQLAARKDEVVALVSGIEGFQAYYLLRTDDGCASVTVFADKAGADESVRQAREWIGDHAAEGQRHHARGLERRGGRRRLSASSVAQRSSRHSRLAQRRWVVARSRQGAVGSPTR